jgi:hypothetical protein
MFESAAEVKACIKSGGSLGSDGDNPTILKYLEGDAGGPDEIRRLGIIAALIEGGVNANDTDWKWGDSALSLAHEYKQYNVIKFLLEVQAIACYTRRCSKRKGEVYNILLQSFRELDFVCMKIVVDSTQGSILINLKDKCGNTPLHTLISIYSGGDGFSYGYERGSYEDNEYYGDEYDDDDDYDDDGGDDELFKSYYDKIDIKQKFTAKFIATALKKKKYVQSSSCIVLYTT